MNPLKTPNALQFTPKVRRKQSGHYESYFIRANHPTQPKALWIRYTIFAPAQGDTERQGNGPEGELWFMYFDRQQGTQFVGKHEIDYDACSFEDKPLNVAIADCHLDQSYAHGAVEVRDVNGARSSCSWNLKYVHQPKAKGCATPVPMFPTIWFSLPFPKAKSVVSAPMAVFSGTIEIGDQKIEIDEWVGSQNHNWGSKHTDRYAWGQVCGFDDRPDWFLELATAQVEIAGRSTPWFTPLTLVMGDQRIELNDLRRAVQNTGSYAPFDWHFEASDEQVIVRGRIWAHKKDVVALLYRNPPGGAKYCLNTKIASCELTVEYKDGPKVGQKIQAFTQSKAALEILVNQLPDGMKVSA